MHAQHNARLGVRVRYYLRWARGLHSQNQVLVAPSFIMCVSIWLARKACTKLDGDFAVVGIGGFLSVWALTNDRGYD